MTERATMIYRKFGEVRAEQERRRLAQEAMPAVAWEVKRHALVDCGLVAERAKEREESQAEADLI